MPKFIMLVGAPCSGKSTYIDTQLYPLLIGDKGVVVSTDCVIETLANEFGFTYNEIFKDSIKLAEKIMYKMLEYAISNDKNIIWDQTNMTVKTRASKLKCIPANYEKECIAFEVDRDLILERNKNRYGKTIPVDVIDNMLKSYERPDVIEGFKNITIKVVEL